MHRESIGLKKTKIEQQQMQRSQQMWPCVTTVISTDLREMFRLRGIMVPLCNTLFAIDWRIVIGNGGHYGQHNVCGPTPTF